MNVLETVAPPLADFRVLVCDDQPDVCEALRLLLKSQGWQAVTVDSPAALLRSRRGGEAFDLILLDLNYARDTTSGAEGMDLLASLEAQGNGAPVMVMTAWSSFDLAVEAMRRGACDFIQKPWDNQRLIAAIRKQAESEPAAEVGAGDRRQRAAEALPGDPPQLATLEYDAQCVAGARRWAATTTIFWTPAAGAMAFLAGGRLRQGRAGGAADGEPAGVRSAASRRRRCASRRRCWRASIGTSSIPPPQSASPPCSMASTTTARAGCDTSTARTLRRCCCGVGRGGTPGRHGPDGGSVRALELHRGRGDIRARRRAGDLFRRRHRGRLRFRRRIRRRAAGARIAQPAGAACRPVGGRCTRCSGRVSAADRAATTSP